MQKSVFSKYLVTVLLIIAISFIVLAGVVCSMVSGYSANAKEDAVVTGAKHVTDFLSDTYNQNFSGSFSQYVYLHRDMLGGALELASLDDVENLVLITDDTGAVLLSGTDHAQKYLSAKVPLTELTAMAADTSVTTLTNLGGLLDAKYVICASPIPDTEGSSVGYVLFCSSSSGISSLIETMLKAILVSCMWVMTATMIVVYFISERVTSPLREMSIAAKQYASGKFDVRVPVKGSDEVAELALAFNNMASSLATVEEQRRSFLANVSHDLRTPMTTIAGFIDGILDGAIPPDKQPYYLELIASEVRRLSRLVASLLDISRIQAGDRKFTKTTFDICEMARQILISFEQRIDEKKLNVEFECDRDNMTVYADRDAIHQVLYNICDNAVKFSRPAGTYRITIFAKDKKTFVSVWNEGQGIPEEELPYVFDRFFKSDKSRGLDKTGVGLGLYITKTIIDAHGEEIWVKSAAGEYCEFVFTLQSVVSK